MIRSVVQVVWLTVLGVSFLFAYPQKPAFSAQEVSVADARSVTLVATTKLESAGSFPRFSPDGETVLYTASTKISKGNQTYSVPGIWSVSVKGESKKLLLDNGYNGAMSPTGATIAYCIPQFAVGGIYSRASLGIYNLKTRSPVKLKEIDNCGSFDILWRRDSKALLLWLRRPAGVFQKSVVLDLDNLSDFSLPQFSQKADEENWVEENFIFPRHPIINFYADKTANQGDYGLWVSNRDGTVARRVNNSNVDNISLSPDLKHIAYQENGAVYVATLNFSDKIRPLTFSVALGKSAFADARSNPGGETVARSNVDSYLASGRVLGRVYGPRINPLNGKVIGPSTTYKGTVEFTTFGLDSSAAKVIHEATSIRVGDVVADISIQWASHVVPFQLAGWTALAPHQGTESEHQTTIDSNNLTGTWNGAWSGPGSTPRGFFQAQLTQLGSKISGEMRDFDPRNSSRFSDSPLSGEVQGQRVVIDKVIPIQNAPNFHLRYEGTIESGFRFVTGMAANPKNPSLRQYYFGMKRAQQ